MAIRAMLAETTHFACSPLGCCTLLSISLYSLSMQMPMSKEKTNAPPTLVTVLTLKI